MKKGKKVVWVKIGHCSSRYISKTFLECCRNILSHFWPDNDLKIEARNLGDWPKLHTGFDLPTLAPLQHCSWWLRPKCLKPKLLMNFLAEGEQKWTGWALMLMSFRQGIRGWRATELWTRKGHWKWSPIWYVNRWNGFQCYTCNMNEGYWEWGLIWFVDEFSEILMLSFNCSIYMIILNRLYWICI